MQLISLLPINLREASDLQARAEKVFDVNLNGIDLDEFAMGLQVEREHDDVTGGDMKKVAKIALAHLREVPDYYTKLKASVEPQTQVSSVNEDDHSPSYMTVSSLQAIKSNTEFLLTLINDTTPVDNWAESAISVAAHEISQVADYMRGRHQTTEAFASKAQQKYFYARANDKGLSKVERAKWKKMADEFSSKTDFDTIPNKK